MTTLFGPADIAIGMNDSISRVRLFDGPLDLKWHHCATTSDFIADIFALPFQTSRNDYKEIRHNIGYLVNELIENAVKFRQPGEIMIEASMDQQNFKVKVSNVVNDQTATAFQALLSEITIGDPGDLLISRIEANAADPDASGSGLGLLTLMSDYGVRLAWIFSPVDVGDQVHVETFATIPISQSH
ncbi:ATP-binding protein [Mesorhizobium sp. LHD-90]|uniref:slr1658 superfamily regulator n=1 Tax=Mesorhizobium sp. LHD-90 TaxID=3071414 RepID=UPI0027E0D7E0|nr:ATP-binding protein [Mesorhizobium sp. LHD-90]MDQ6433874.1 ATP-binding protein [Mesorhizobium sp. LHD-90]